MIKTALRNAALVQGLKVMPAPKVSTNFAI